VCRKKGRHNPSAAAPPNNSTSIIIGAGRPQLYEVVALKRKETPPPGETPGGGMAVRPELLAGRQGEAVLCGPGAYRTLV
jgi:hypothetical protein